MNSKELVERLLREAQSASEASKMMAQAKSLRQGDHNPPRDDLYSWQTPEQTTQGLAAAHIVAQDPRIEALEGALASAYDRGYWDGVSDRTQDCDHKDSAREGYQNWLSNNPNIKAIIGGEHGG